MYQIPDDPIIACMMRTGYPPWMQDDYEEHDEYDDDDDDYGVIDRL